MALHFSDQEFSNRKNNTIESMKKFNLDAI